MPSVAITGLFGTQAMPPDMAVEPPIRSCFSSTSALAPASTAVSAATMPPPPDPTITKSTVESHVVISRALRPPRVLLQLRSSKLAGSVDDCYEAEVICRQPTRSGAGEMAGHARTLTYPPEGLGAPKDRHPGPLVESGLPAGTEVFSADDHISLGEDIFYERFPEGMKEGAPRVMNVGGGWVIGMDGKSVLVPEFIEVLTQYDPVSGSHTGDVPARLAALESEGVSRELAFPNADLALFGWPDREGPRFCFRIYNEHIEEVQELPNNRIFGVGLINWGDADGARRTLNELK